MQASRYVGEAAFELEARFGFRRCQGVDVEASVRHAGELRIGAIQQGVEIGRIAATYPADMIGVVAARCGVISHEGGAVRLEGFVAEGEVMLDGVADARDEVVFAHSRFWSPGRLTDRQAWHSREFADVQGHDVKAMSERDSCDQKVMRAYWQA